MQQVIGTAGFAADAGHFEAAERLAVDLRAGAAAVDIEIADAESFARQAAMATLGVRLGRVAPGEVELLMAHRADLTQQHGFLHAGVLTAIADSRIQNDSRPTTRISSPDTARLRW